MIRANMESIGKDRIVNRSNRWVWMPVVISGFVSVALVAAALLLVRSIGANAYEDYRAKGGSNGFWPWLARNVCGVALPGVEDRDEPLREAGPKAQTEQAKNGHREGSLAELKARIAKLEAEEKAAEVKLKKLSRGKKGVSKKDAKRRVDVKSRSHRGDSVKTGGKSSFVAGDGKTPYRVNGIRGIEFGSTENAPAEGVRPIMSVSTDANGNEVFQGIKWRENKKLTESVYGFDKAMLTHSFETEELASVTFNRSFPFTEEGMAQAVEFYKAMSNEASADLGFKVIDIDRTGNAKSATICEFRNGDGDTSIRGAISAWSDKNLTVTFSVSDKACSKELRAQSNAAYESGVAESVNARIERSRGDYSDRMERAASYLE